MVTFATPATVVCNVSFSFGYSFVPEVPDDCHNPKMWARWFREFLEELLGRWRAVPIFLPHTMAENRKKVFARSSPLRYGEWKLKRWKQEYARSA